MNMIAAQEIKRRGMGALDGMLAEGPVRIIKNNRPRYVVIDEADFDSMLDELAQARLAASKADLKAGRVRRGTASDLLAELRGRK